MFHALSKILFTYRTTMRMKFMSLHTLKSNKRIKNLFYLLHQKIHFDNHQKKLPEKTKSNQREYQDVRKTIFFVAIVLNNDFISQFFARVQSCFRKGFKEVGDVMSFCHFLQPMTRDAVDALIGTKYNAFH